MKKNYRRIPNFIEAKINSLTTDNLQVCIIKKIRQSEFDNYGIRNFNFNIDGDDLTGNLSYIPNQTTGAFSRKNINGYKIVFRDQEKVSKTWYAGERPIFGDWSKGSFSLYITKMVFPSVTIPPRELSINAEILDDEIIEETRVLSLKIFVDEVLNRNDYNFRESLFFNLNLLQENFGDSDVYETTLTREDYLRTLIVEWDFFPPGNREADIQRILQGRQNATRTYINALNDRYDVLMSLNPQHIISGRSGMRNYFGVQFTDTLVAFENLQYGNAIYILFENWRELSRLSRTELLERPGNQFYRVKHKFGWQTLLARIIEGRRNR